MATNLAIDPKLLDQALQLVKSPCWRVCSPSPSGPSLRCRRPGPVGRRLPWLPDRFAFLLALAALVLLMLVPLRRVRWAVNLLALAATVFVAVQLGGVYRPALNPIRSPYPSQRSGTSARAATPSWSTTITSRRPSVTRWTIARVGNSGNTTEPSIHLQVQSVPYGIGDVDSLDVDSLDVDTVIRDLHTYRWSSPTPP